MVALTSTECAFYSTRSHTTVLWVEGDSYVSGAAGLAQSLRDAGHIVVSTALGGSTMTNIRDRLISNASLIRQVDKLIVWDGAQAEFTTADAYADLLETGLNAVGATPFVLIPEATPYGTADDTEQLAILAEFESRWPGRVFDWRDSIAHTNGVINQNRMLDYPTDPTHLNDTAHDEAVTGLENAGFI